MDNCETVVSPIPTLFKFCKETINYFVACLPCFKLNFWKTRFRIGEFCEKLLLNKEGQNTKDLEDLSPAVFIQVPSLGNLRNLKNKMSNSKGNCQNV